MFSWSFCRQIDQNSKGAGSEEVTFGPAHKQSLQQKSMGFFRKVGNFSGILAWVLQLITLRKRSCQHKILARKWRQNAVSNHSWKWCLSLNLNVFHPLLYIPGILHVCHPKQNFHNLQDHSQGVVRAVDASTLQPEHVRFRSGSWNLYNSYKEMMCNEDLINYWVPLHTIFWNT